ncbi:MAG: NAD-dependent epimerase/dehydratase family protein [Halioglobus sp.]
MDALVIGGTGPTGHFVVNGLLERGYRVAILHTGNHEVDEIPPIVEHIHTNPYDESELAIALGDRSFDLCVATYGRLRVIAQLLSGRVGRFLSVGGQPAYRGYMNPELLDPPGLPVPVSEERPLVRGPEEDEKAYRIIRTEEAVFRHHPDATHFRYPYVYGPYQAAPREWCIVKRIMDGRPHIILPDGGLTLHSFGYAENMAHALLLAVDQPQAACGQIYNCADEQTLTLRQTIEIIAAGMDHDWRIVNMPWELAMPACPLVMQPLTTHRVMDIGKLQQQLGYRDRVDPKEALMRTVRWLVANPPQADGVEHMVLQDPFDYQAEDLLVERWDAAMAGIEPVEFDSVPGYGMGYSGPGGRPRSSREFVE